MPAYSRILLPWDSQPQEPVGVDWDNPLLQNAEFVRLGSSIWWNPTNRAITRAGAITPTATPAGVGQILSSSQYESYPAATANGGTGPWTLAGLFMPVSGLVANQAIVGMAESPGASVYDRSIKLHSSTYEWQGYLYDGAPKVANSGVVPVNGRTDCVIVTTDTTTLIVAANGIENGLAVSSGGYTGYTSAEICLGQASNVWGGTVVVPLVLRTTGYWSLAMRRSFFANPWQVFAPRSIWVPVSQAAAPGGLAANPLFGGGAAAGPLWGYVA